MTALINVFCEPTPCLSLVDKHGATAKVVVNSAKELLDAGGSPLYDENANAVES